MYMYNSINDCTCTCTCTCTCIEYVHVHGNQQKLLKDIHCKCTCRCIRKCNENEKFSPSHF